ncbi:MAG: glycine--tRNA ligase subunit beta [Nitrospinota bacterium]|nr:glycine--tRNA ligase subunit beta [Nitrospinota bacterium]
MKKLLLEIGTEEIPASFIQPAVEKLKEIASEKLKTAHLPFTAIETVGTPRRLALFVSGLPEMQERVTRKVMGPPAKAGFDKDGKPAGAALGFAKKFGKDPKDIKTEPTPKGDYLYLDIEEGGGSSSDILKSLLPEIITSLGFPKTMRWGDYNTRFARPIRSIISILGDNLIEFNLDSLSSGRSTFGHRFLHDGRIEIKNPDSYLNELEKASVIVSPERRKEKILQGLAKVEKDTGNRVIKDDELANTIGYITEFPVAVAGTFDKSYLDLPRELLITVMKYHQKYFSMEDPSGKITNHFVAFSNIDCEDISVIRRGFERVLSARLSDARFFFDEDRKKTLSDFSRDLAGVTFQKGLGTIADKVSRIASVAQEISEIISPAKKAEVETASRLCKSDLMTSMVFEFTELQGIMGREYALAEGIDREIAIAIDEHYKPRFSGDTLPSNDIAVCVALADKIDTICGFFALGKIPSGSEDPFSLRRHALGIIRILLDGDDTLSIQRITEIALNTLPPGTVKDPGQLGADILSFFKGRLKSEFSGMAIPYDVVDAVVEADFTNLPDTLKRATALAEMKKEEYSESLSITFKRAANIVEKHKAHKIDESLLEEETEKRLYEALIGCEKKLKPLIDAKNFSAVLQEIASIRPSLDAFFDSVMVMVENDIIRQNRLSLLRRVVILFERIADFSRLVFSA